MTRGELIEKMARAHYAKYFEVVADMEPAFHEQPESHQDRMREAMEAALTAIEASGLCIVPVDATEAMMDSVDLGDQHWRIDTVYRLMIEAGRI